MSDNINERNRALLAGTIIYAIGNFGTKFLSFLIVPLYTYYIPPADLGDYDILCTTVNLLTPLLTMQISDAAFRWMIADDDNILPCVSAAYKLIAVNCTVAAGIILLINFFIPIYYCGYFISILVLGRILGSIQKLLRGLKNQKMFAASGIVYTSVFLLLNVLFICVLKQGVAALLRSAVIANAAAILYILAHERRLLNIDLKTNHRNLQKEMLRYSIPLVPSTLNWWIMSASDRYIIRFFMDNAANGIYAVANKFPSILSTLFLMFNNSWIDMALAEGETKDDVSEYYSKVFERLYILSFTAILVLVPATKIATKFILNDSYEEAAVYIAFLYLGTVFQSFSSFYSVGYFKHKKTSGAASTSICGAAVNIAVNLFFIRSIGLHAASVSTFLGFFFMWVIRVRQTRASLPIIIKKRRFVPMFAAGVSMCAISIWSAISADIVLAAAGTILFLIFNKDMMIAVLNKFKRAK